MKLIFAGTPEFAAHALKALIAAGHEISLVLTQPDRPAGRGMSLQPSAVKHVALQHGLPLFQPERLKDPTTHAPIRAAQAELMVVVAYGLILPQAVLDIPPRGCINIHASLLPRGRGAAPIHRAIEAGDTQTGVTLMQMDAGLDTGPMLAMQAIAIGEHETTGQLHDRLAQLGGETIVAALAQPDSLAPQPQAEAGATYANKIGKSEAQLDWRQPAAVLARKIRAFDPFPGASLVLADQPVKIWRAVALATQNSGNPGEISSADASGIVVACGEGALRLLELQKPGGRRLASADFLRGHPLCKLA